MGRNRTHIENSGVDGYVKYPGYKSRDLVGSELDEIRDRRSDFVRR